MKTQMLAVGRYRQSLRSVLRVKSFKTSKVLNGKFFLASLSLLSPIVARYFYLVTTKSEIIGKQRNRRSKKTKTSKQKTKRIQELLNMEIQRNEHKYLYPSPEYFLLQIANYKHDDITFCSVSVPACPFLSPVYWSFFSIIDFFFSFPSHLDYKFSPFQENNIFV